MENPNGTAPGRNQLDLNEPTVTKRAPAVDAKEES
jgi:hypothetical protein